MNEGRGVNTLFMNHLFSAINDDGMGVVDVDIEGVHSNIVMVNIRKPGLTAPQFCQRLDTVSIHRLLPALHSTM